MSKSLQIEVTCPKCNTKHPFMMWESINTMLDPEMKQAVRDKSAFLFECPECGTKTNTDYPTLYHQMEDRIMIHYVQTDEDEDSIKNMLKGDGENSMFKDMLDADYLIRIVRSQNEFLEKLHILDAGLDDRVIEVIKTIVWASFNEAHPEYDDIKLLYCRDNDEDSLVILADGKYVGSYIINEAMYNDLADKLRDRIPDMRKSEPCIDRDWAFEAFRTVLNEG